MDNACCFTAFSCSLTISPSSSAEKPFLLNLPKANSSFVFNVTNSFFFEVIVLIGPTKKFNNVSPIADISSFFNNKFWFSFYKFLFFCQVFSFFSKISLDFSLSL